MARATDRSLVLDGVSFRVDTTSILNGVWLKVSPGRVCGLFGRNGSGKSTLLQIAGGQLSPTSGIVRIDGTRLHKRSIWTRFAKVAYLPQDTMLPGGLKVKWLARALPGLQALIRGSHVLADRLNQRIGTLSGGERRCLELLMVISFQRDYLLLDEPFTGVAPRIIDEMAEHIHAAVEHGQAVLLTDHYHRYVLDLIDDAYLLRNQRAIRLPGDGLRDRLVERGYLSPRDGPGERSDSRGDSKQP
jgi:lipopolysaccharide export system ATP-binding protein